MTPLKQKLAAMIEADGPLPVSTFMQLCLHHPEHGYYAARPGLGRDFRTAPETSQVFGEVIGLWATYEWAAMGAPAPFSLVELGPGRGVFMADILRAAAPQGAMVVAANVFLVEPSAPLRQVQSGALAGAAAGHLDALADAPPGPLILLANEYLDCLPARQFVQVGGAWHERVVGLGPSRDLAFGLAADRAPGANAPPAQSALELQPGLETLVAQLAERGGPMRALFVDYGPGTGPPSDTLRAFRDGQQVDPLNEPGACDLTVDVDFTRLAALAREAGLDVAGPAPQGQFLGALGVEARMRALISANPSAAADIHAGVAELVEPDKMGQRFKAICLSSPGLPPPAGFSSP